MDPLAKIIFAGGLFFFASTRFTCLRKHFQRTKKIACHHPLPTTALLAPAESRVRVLGERGRVKQRCAAAGATVGFGREERKLRAAAAIYGLK